RIGFAQTGVIICPVEYDRSRAVDDLHIGNCVGRCLEGPAESIVIGPGLKRADRESGRVQINERERVGQVREAVYIRWVGAIEDLSGIVKSIAVAVAEARIKSKSNSTTVRKAIQIRIRIIRIRKVSDFIAVVQSVTVGIGIPR